MLEIKQHRFIGIIIVALGVTLMGMSTVCAEGLQFEPDPEVVAMEAAAQQAEIELGERLRSIEADPLTVINDLVSRFATDEVTAEQLRATLETASSKKLAEIIQNAENIEDVATILTGKTAEELASPVIFTPEILGSDRNDYLFTPVTLCRIVDSRLAGGAFTPGTSRTYNVYGFLGSQGGSICPSPRGEPRGVHINVAAVPVSGSGNFSAGRADRPPPDGSLVNYKAGVQNIANAANVETRYFLGEKELKIHNRFGTAHVVIDVLGYYYEGEPEKIVAASSSGTLTGDIIVATSFTTLAIKTVTIPTSGRVILTGEAIFDNRSSGVGAIRCRFTENGSILGSVWSWEPGDAGDAGDFPEQQQSHFYFKNVTSGTKTYALSCFNPYFGREGPLAANRSLAVLFIKEGL